MPPDAARARRVNTGERDIEISCTKIVAEAPVQLQPLAVGATEVARLVGVARSTWWRMVSAGKAPAPIAVGGRRVWLVAAVQRWLEMGAPSAAEFGAREGRAKR